MVALATTGHIVSESGRGFVCVELFLIRLTCTKFNSGLCSTVLLAKTPEIMSANKMSKSFLLHWLIIYLQSKK